MVYSSGKKALDNISLQMESPNLIGILGPNGAPAVEEDLKDRNSIASDVASISGILSIP
jgi:ABC-type uncharacterized transport system ATPase component